MGRNLGRAVADSLLDTFERLNLLTSNSDRSAWQRPASTSLEAIRLSVLAQAAIQTIERYYLAIALLLQAAAATSPRKRWSSAAT